MPAHHPRTAWYQWLCLAAVPRLGGGGIQKLLQQYSLPELFSLSSADLRHIGLSDRQIQALQHPDQSAIERTLRWLEQPQHHLVTLDCPDYPDLLKQAGCPPPLLYVVGNPACLSAPQLAVVGSRAASASGRNNTRWLVAECAALGLTITSGLATGIDGAAHQAALDAGGTTIAVMGTGCDQIYPARHRPLAEAMVAAGGALVSEFAPGTRADARFFPRRNRIIAGLSLGVLVVEAALKSGSLITARYAVEQGREVFAVPGSIGNPQTRGCHALIRDGAKLTERVADIIEELPFSLQHLQIEEKVMQELPSSQLLDNVGDEATPIDAIAARSGLSIEQVLQQLLELELQGVVEAVAGGYQRLGRADHV